MVYYKVYYNKQMNVNEQIAINKVMIINEFTKSIKLKILLFNKNSFNKCIQRFLSREKSEQ